MLKKTLGMAKTPRVEFRVSSFRGDAENAGLEYAGLENAAPTWNEKSREHR